MVNKNAIMLDIETLSTKTDAAIIEIGAVFFRIYGNQHRIKPILHKHNIEVFHVLVKPENYGSVDRETLLFWENILGVDSLDVSYFNTQDREPLKDALNQLSQWIEFMQNRFGVDIILSKGAFDFTILKHHYEFFKIDIPWSYRMERDFRTVDDLFPTEELEESIWNNPNQYLGADLKKHCALSDAWVQAYLTQVKMEMHVMQKANNIQTRPRGRIICMS